MAEDQPSWAEIVRHAEHGESVIRTGWANRWKHTL
ncbi:MAG: hypothetical protein QOJ73_239 [Streptosporangiaceae bacterium]|jgi:hypothetical protein|nr:hypothetical protein [Streptosporangiaceae bacterium]